MRAVGAVVLGIAFLVVAAGVLRAGPEPGMAERAEAQSRVEARSGAAAEQSERAEPPPLPKAADWLALLQEVDRARAQAYSEGDAAPLERFMSGEALAAEQAAIAALRSAGATVEGWSTTINSVSPRELSVERAVLLVGDVRGPYDVVSADGSRRHVPAAGARNWRVFLEPGPRGWRVVRSEAVTSPG